MRRAIFLDRDGVINKKAPGDDYVTSWQDMIILDGVEHAISLCKQAGFRVIVVTNQRCVAKGILSEASLQVLHDRLCTFLSDRGAKLDALYCCLHEESSCDCRKPQPGMLLQAAKDHAIELSSSWIVGDSVKDVQAGKQAGCKTALLGGQDTGATGEPDVRAGTLLEAVRMILACEAIAAASC